jgi:hypothetical protein
LLILVKTKNKLKLADNVSRLGEVPLLEIQILALTVLRHFAKPVLYAV